MRLPGPRGRLTGALAPDLATRHSLSARTAEIAEQVVAGVDDALADDDVQLALAICCRPHHRGFDAGLRRLEWDTELLGLRAGPERRTWLPCAGWSVRSPPRASRSTGRSPR